MKTRAVFLFALAALTFVVITATADTIYLKNGREIRTSSATVDGDRVRFTQFGQPVAIPMSEVERIVEDDYQDPEPQRRPVAAAPETQPPAGTGGPEVVAPIADAIPPEETREYWQDRVRAVESERLALQQELVTLRRTEKALFLGLYQAHYMRPQLDDVLARIEANERALPELRREARRLGVPAGWLRV